MTNVPAVPARSPNSGRRPFPLMRMWAAFGVGLVLWLVCAAVSPRVHGWGCDHPPVSADCAAQDDACAVRLFATGSLPLVFDGPAIAAPTWSAALPSWVYEDAVSPRRVRDVAPSRGPPAV